MIPQNEVEDIPIQIGDTLTGADAEIVILDYDLEIDMYTVDLFNYAGKLLRHKRIFSGDFVRTVFRRRGKR